MSQAAVPNYLGNDFNAAAPGHRFNLYFPIWRNDWSVDKSGKAQTIGQTLSVQPVIDVLKGLRNRQRQLIDALPETDRLSLPAKSTAPFATGLGNEHPVENGFAFLTPYGLPYLAGSGVKGVLRRAAEELALFGHPLPAGEGRGEGDLLMTQEIIDALFGPQNIRKPEDARRGALDVWDVFPDPKGGKLVVEIMTPHYSDYYQGKTSPAYPNGATPHDAGQPNPIPFLAVPAGSSFDFHVVCHPSRLPEHLRQNWKNHLQAIFEHAFDWLGFGAKTAVGYGAMRRDKEAEDNAAKVRAEHEAEAQRREEAKRRQAALDAMSPNQRRIEELRAEIEMRLEREQGRKLPVSDQFWGERIKKLARTAAESAEWTADEKTALADMLENYAVRLMALEPKELRKQLKLSALRGLA